MHRVKYHGHHADRKPVALALVSSVHRLTRIGTPVLGVDLCGEPRSHPTGRVPGYNGVLRRLLRPGMCLSRSNSEPPVFISTLGWCRTGSGGISGQQEDDTDRMSELFLLARR